MRVPLLSLYEMLYARGAVAHPLRVCWWLAAMWAGSDSMLLRPVGCGANRWEWHSLAPAPLWSGEAQCLVPFPVAYLSRHRRSVL